MIVDLILIKLRVYHARLTNKWFLVSQLVQSALCTKPSLNILFTDHPGLKPVLQKAFKFSKHNISFLAFSAENIKKHDLVVPLTLPDLKSLNEQRKLVNSNLIPIPSTQSIVLADDKHLFNQSLTAKGYGKHIPKIGGKQQYPYMLKKSIGHSSENCHIIFNSQQELGLSETIANPDYFTQEMIKGKSEYATHILFKDQKIISSLNIQYYFDTETPIKGKNKPLYTKICHCPHLAMFSAILVLIGFEGLCCFNYKELEDILYIIESNPRFGGSLASYFPSFIKQL